MLHGLRAQTDEDTAHDQRHHDSDEQNPVLMYRRYREVRHDDHEDEEIVDAQRILGDVSGGEGGRVLAAPEDPDADPEGHGAADVERDPLRRFTHGDLVGFPIDQKKIEKDEREQPREGCGPDPCGHGHRWWHACSSDLALVRLSEVFSARSLCEPTAPGPTGPC